MDKLVELEIRLRKKKTQSIIISNKDLVNICWFIDLVKDRSKHNEVFVECTAPNCCLGIN